MVDIENNIKSLVEEFKVIKNSFQPLIEDIQKIKKMEAEFRNFKTDVITQIKKLEFELRKSSAEKHWKADTNMIEQFEREIRKRLNENFEKKKREIDVIIDEKIKNIVKNDKKRDDITEKINNQFKLAQNFTLNNIEKLKNEINNKIKKVEKNFRDDISKFEQFEKHNLENSEEIKRTIQKLSQNDIEIDKKHTELQSSDRKMISSIIAELGEIKKEIKKNIISVEKNMKDIEEINNWFKERDKSITKEMNTKKRHIDQIVNEINNARKRDYENLSITEENSKKIKEVSTKIAKLTGELELTKNNFKEMVNVELKNIKKNLLEKKEIDKIQTDIMEKLKDEIKFLKENTTKWINEKKIEVFDKPILELKNEIEKINKNMEKMASLPTTEQYNYMKEVITKLKNDTDRNSDLIAAFKKDFAAILGKVQEIYDMKEQVNVINKQLIELDSNLNNSLKSMKSELDGLSIKVENTSKIMKDLGKVL